MPKSYSSNSSSGARLDSGLYSNRCFTGSFNSNPSRARSPSPSEYYQQRYIFQDRLEQRLFELNKFVHHAVDRFLDKQTVLDLIRSYDNDDDLCSDLADDHKQSHNDTPVVSDNVLMRASSACSSAARSIVDKISDNLKIVQPVAKRERDINNKAESDYSQHDFIRTLEDGQEKFKKRFGTQSCHFPRCIGLIMAKLFHMRASVHRRGHFGEL